MTNHLFDTLFGARAPETPFILGEGALNTEAFARLSARYAHQLVLSGLARGDRVIWRAEKCIEALALYIACVRAGVVLVPLNPAYTAAEVAYFVGDAAPKLILCDGKDVESTRAVAGDAAVSALAEFAVQACTQPDSFENAACGPNDLAAILYTSGTTGRSKGAMISHANLASNATTLVEAWRFTKDDVLIHALPVFHTHGLFVATNTVLASGAAMIFQERFDASAVLAAMQRATVLMGVPTFYTRLLAQPGLTREAVRRMRLFISGSAPLLAESHAQWQACTGHAILERYGMTETNMITSNPYDGARVAGSVGPPLPGVSLRVVDPESGAAMPVGEIGMIEVKGPNVFSGYWKQPEKTAAEFRPDGYFITGDLGRFDENRYVTIVGRGKDLIICGGFNVYPKEVEEAIDALDGVEESAVVGALHPDMGEGVVAYVTARAGVQISEHGILDALGARLARFKLPRRVMIVDQLPRNAMGKVQKALLREQCKDIFSA